MIPLTDRLINIYKGIIKCKEVNFSRPEFIKYFQANETFNLLFLNEAPEDRPTIWCQYEKNGPLELKDLTVTRQKDRTDTIVLKRQATLKVRYGVTNPMHSELLKNRVKETCLEKYGSENCFGNSEVQKKIKVTNIKNLGVEYPTQSREVLSKRVETYKKNYGVESPLQNKDIQAQVKETCLERYGVDNPSKSKEVVDKIIKIKTEMGYYTAIEGKTLTQISMDAGKSSAWACKIFKKYGQGAFLDWINFNISPSPQFPNKVEVNASLSLELEFFNKEVLEAGRNRPDFKLADGIFLDIDGLYWHSEAVKVLSSLPGTTKDYHSTKRKLYEAEGKRLIQVRENEVKDKLEIVRSMIFKITKPETYTKIHARKCDIRVIDTKQTYKFILENHLQGPGHRLKGIFLFYNNEPVMCISYKKSINKVEGKDTYEISRMCSKLYTVVVGGASKLLKYLEKELPPGSILKTAADLRYSTGKTYEQLGFEYYNETLSFGWTDLKTVHHRLKVHKDSDAGKLGLFKIWDAGQRYYTKLIK